MHFRKKIAGFTFVEIMVALAINVILMAALLTAIVTNLNHYKRTININRLNQQLSTALMLMSNDIRRAGYWANASSDIGLHQNNNPFMVTGSTDISITGSCILFTYDKNADSSLPSISAATDDERYGFRLSNQILQARPPGAAFDCATASGNWENMTDSQIIQITALSFTLNTTTLTTGPGTRGITRRSVDISITGRLASDNTVTKTLTQHVRIRNDKYIP